MPVCVRVCARSTRHAGYVYVKRKPYHTGERGGTDRYRCNLSAVSQPIPTLVARVARTRTAPGIRNRSLVGRILDATKNVIADKRYGKRRVRSIVR